MEVEIREAKIEDLESIQALNLKLFEREFSKGFDKTLDTNWTFSDLGTDYFKKKILGEDSFAAVAVVDHEIVAYLAGGETEVYSYRTIKKLAELENMMVLKEYRNMKIGSKLVDAFFKWCKKKNIKRVRVAASAGNVKAINFYRKNGFKDYEVTLEGDI